MIYLFGSNGMLGNYIKKVLGLGEKNCFSRDDFDAENDNIENVLFNLIPYDSVVINCIGIIPQKISSDDIRKYIKVNTLFPLILEKVCNDKKSKLIHITTDCVFSGSEGKYVESDKHTETNIYGVSKSLGEPKTATVIRTSIIGHEKNHKKSLLEWTIKQKVINGYSTHYWNGVTCLQLAKIIKEIIEKNLFWKGVRHIFSPESVSKYELIKIIIEEYNLDIKLNKVEKDFADKTLSSKYDLLFLIPPLKNQIKEQKEFGIF